MRVLVTGNRGYIGGPLVRQLLARGASVTGLDCDYYRASDYRSTPPDIPTLAMDIRDVGPADLAGHDAVLHLAGLSNDPLGDIDPLLTHDINCAASERLARVARDAGIRRFVFSSSCSNYGVGGDELLNEESPLRPVTPYAVSKVQAEECIDRLADDDFTPVYLRSGTAYGLSPRIRFDLVVNNLAAWAIATGQVRLKSDGSAWRPLVHAEDMARAFVDALYAPRDLVHRQAFNVGRTADSVQIRTVAERVREAIPGTRITFADEACADVRTYRVDCEKISTLGYQPQWTLAEGIASLRDAFTESPVPVSEFEGPLYQRVARVRALIDEGQLDGGLRWSRRDAA